MNRALLVGINNYPLKPLNGCVNDVEDIANFLVSRCGFSPEEIRLLVDERATKKSIVDRLGWLLTGIKSGDRILFHFSGHGVQLPTRNPQGEVDGLDEAICPVDFDWTEEYTLRDKDFKRIFSSIPDGVEFLWISDSCHSGDLSRGLRQTDYVNRTIPPPADIGWRVKTALSRGIRIATLETMVSELNLALISGCRADQTSADSWFGDRANGALTYYLIKQLNSNNGLELAISEIVDNVRVSLKTAGFEQEPQLEGNNAIKARTFLGI